MRCEACGVTIPAGINVCIDCGKKTDGGPIDPDLLMQSIARRHGSQVGAVAARAEVVGDGGSFLVACVVAPFQIAVACLAALGWQFVAGAMSLGFACWLRLNAQSLAWPKSYRYRGEREDTVWAVREQAYQDIAMWLALLGVALIIVSALRWRGEQPED